MGPAGATCNRHRPEHDERSLIIQWCSDDPRQVPITTFTGTRGRITGYLIEHCGPEGRRSHPPYYRAWWVAASVEQSGITSIWWAVGAPAPATQTFQIGFHVLVGLMMALFYAFVLEPAMPWSTTVKALVYLAVVWLVNALIVLPATGEGFAGSANLTLAGIAWFSAAHSIFFMILVYGFAFLFKTCDRESHSGII